MAGEAASVVHGRVTDREGLRLVRVAVGAQSVPRPGQKLRVRRRMRLVARRALPGFERGVKVRSPALELRDVVTRAAQRDTRRLDVERLGGIGGDVAGITGSREHRGMGRGLQQIREVGRVRVMAGCARRRGDGVVPVGGLHPRGVRLVTAEAEIFRRIDEEVGLGRGMGEVAGLAADGLQDRVNDFAFVGCPVVTLVAILRPFGLQKGGVLRGVRIVTGGALLGLLEGGVDQRFVESDRFFRMTAEAESVSVLLQEELADDAVTNVAGLALGVRDSGMNDLQRANLLRELGVTREARLGLEFPRRRERAPRRGQHHRDGHHDRDDGRSGELCPSAPC